MTNRLSFVIASVMVLSAGAVQAKKMGGSVTFSDEVRPLKPGNSTRVEVGNRCEKLHNEIYALQVRPQQHPTAMAFTRRMSPRAKRRGRPTCRRQNTSCVDPSLVTSKALEKDRTAIEADGDLSVLPFNIVRFVQVTPTPASRLPARESGMPDR